MNKEKTPLIIFYRKGEDGTIGIELYQDVYSSIQIERQLISSMECYLRILKEDMLDRLSESNDDSDREFT